MTRYNYEISTTGNDPGGTAQISVTGTAVLGTLTAFNSELFVGSIIHSSGYDLVVATVTDNTHATVVTAPASNFSLASWTVTHMENVESLGVTPPKSTFKPWVSTVDLGNGTARALGRPSAVWQWGFMSTANRNSLRAYCTGKSARVYIRTRKNDSSDAYVTYSAVMLWPDDEDRFNRWRLNFSIEFRDLVAL